MTARTAAKPSARVRLLEAADELFYNEGIQTVGIDRVIEHAGVAKASLYNTYGSKEQLVGAYLELRGSRVRDRINRVLESRATPRERLLGVFEAQSEALTSSGYHGCPFVRATAEAPEDSSISRIAHDHRAWLRGLLTGLATECGYADPGSLARQLHFLYDGAANAVRMDKDSGAGAAAREAAAVLLAAAPLTEPGGAARPAPGMAAQTP
ncbi:TetR/AcrR family transcriptional regulator [Streptomyces fructofermentans]|uniref:Transcriptional regulator, TetR family protein n=1 Tax=Streptomyces fructofermentans TaxID=152141 RepID=A0A918NTR9_9ACTN|nr:TetR/AcrR family transcriptional regulator [Streptomyces fructofermentans]GGX95246.1 putative transcriptional regulator, TetR family protein [Streptomyces fructofermentans]